MEPQQLHLTLKAKTRKRWTKADKRELRKLLGEGKKPREIAAIMGISIQRVCKAKSYHVKRIRKSSPLKRATTKALAQELIDRGTTHDMPGRTAISIFLAFVALAVVFAIIKVAAQV
jgi:hypothetical protein